MRKLYFFITFVFVAFFINAQSISPELVSNAGDEFSNATITISWSLGEVMTETYTAGDMNLSQGFNQGIMDFVPIKELPNLDYTINNYPNPTQAIITVDIIGLDDNQTLNAKIYSINGVFIEEIELNQTKNIDFVNYAYGIYLIYTTLII